MREEEKVGKNIFYKRGRERKSNLVERSRLEALELSEKGTVGRKRELENQSERVRESKEGVEREKPSVWYASCIQLPSSFMKTSSIEL